MRPTTCSFFFFEKRAVPCQRLQGCRELHPRQRRQWCSRVSAFMKSVPSCSEHNPVREERPDSPGRAEPRGSRRWASAFDMKLKCCVWSTGGMSSVAWTWDALKSQIGAVNVTKPWCTALSVGTFHWEEQFNKRRLWLSSKDVNIGYNNGKELCRWAAWVSTAKVNTTVNVWHQYCRMMRVKILWPVRVKSSSGNDWCFGLKEFARVCLYLDSYVVVLIHSHRKPQANCSVTPVSSKQPTDAVCLWQAGKVSSR